MLSFVEQTFGIVNQNTKIPYIVTNSFPELGKLTALRFIEWVCQNPNGVISLPTGKTPEFFIKWTQHIIKNWDNEDIKSLRDQFQLKQKPCFDNIKFVQIDEFYPIPSHQHNSFFYYVNRFYLEGLGIKKENCLLINSDDIPLVNGKNFSDVFPNYQVDLSLRYRAAKDQIELDQQQSIFMIDQWCQNYEHQIREWGGIGFFLGGIGPDGHIAFNTKGSDHFSTTRLTSTNFETQAVAAGDLGGMAVSRNRLVITIGLGTITYNKEAVAIIFAASESKAHIIQDALESDASVQFPATSLHGLKNARFYLTEGATVKLQNYKNAYYSELNEVKHERAIIDLCGRINKYGDKVVLEDLLQDEICSTIPNVSMETFNQVANDLKSKLERGSKREHDQVFLHTGPHHDDIMLGIMPHVNRQLRSASNESHFAVLTSGFTAVTNQFLLDLLKDTLKLIEDDQIQMIDYPDFFKSGYALKWDKDVYHYLNKVASRDDSQKRRGICHRVVRVLTLMYSLLSKDELMEQIQQLIDELHKSYDGEKNSPEVQQLKGRIREFEEELVWAHYGIRVADIHHLRLGFYTGDIFTPQPDKERDVQPILKLIEEINPTLISLALDPEGSGPDTHYKVLQAIAEALRQLSKTRDLSHLRIWGYRNVWHRFHPSDVNLIIPVSMNSMAVLRESFSDCYLSQVDAPFPSYEYDGKFSELTQKIWTEQLKQIQLVLGKDYFYKHPSPMIRATHGLIYLKEMSVAEFLKHARELQKRVE